MPLVVGILAGFLVTVIVTLLWPKGGARWLRPLAAAGLGILVAYLVLIYS